MRGGSFLSALVFYKTCFPVTRGGVQWNEWDWNHAVTVTPGSDGDALWRRQSDPITVSLLSLGWLACAALWPGGISSHHSLDCYTIRTWKNPKSWSPFTAVSHQRTPSCFLWQEASRRNYHWLLYACNLHLTLALFFVCLFFKCSVHTAINFHLAQGL